MPQEPLSQKQPVHREEQGRAIVVQSAVSHETKLQVLVQEGSMSLSGLDTSLGSSGQCGLTPQYTCEEAEAGSGIDPADFPSAVRGRDSHQMWSTLLTLNGNHTPELKVDRANPGVSLYLYLGWC